MSKGHNTAKMPKYVLKLKQFSRKKAVIFRRNYLSIQNFHAVNNTWVFEENFSHYNIIGNFKLIIHSEDINSIFSVDYKTLKIKGSPSTFGVFLRLPEQNLPIHAHNTIGYAEYYLSCFGKNLPYDDGHGIAETRKKRNISRLASSRLYSDTSSRYPSAVPNSVSWGASHPFQGGKVSPK